MRNVTLLLLLIISYCISFAQPANDACPNAILIPNVNNFCSSNGGGTTVSATDDVATTGGYAAAACWGTGAVTDVWFKFVAVASDVSITINGNQGSPAGGTLNRPQVVLGSGTCGGTINELVCGSPPSGQHIIQIYRGGLTIGQTYYIRVDGFGGNTGTFQYCINNYFPVPAPDGDCPTAVVLCDKNGFTVPDVSGSGAVATEMNSAACFEYDPFTGNVESSSTWYAFTFATSGTFNFVINPSNPSDDIDFALFRLPNGIGNCAGKVTVRCEAASCVGSTGIRASSTDTDEPPGCNFPSDNYVSQVNVTAGQSYALAINNFSSTGNGFGITFGGTANFQGPTAIINDSDADDQICPGDPITFTDVSTPPPSGSLVTWRWNFGTGATPATFSGQNPPAVTYSTTGTKTISLTVTSNRGCLVTATKVITVATVPPTVNIVASQNPVCAGTNVTFTATPTNAGASPTYQWYLNNIPVGSNSNTYSNTGLNSSDQVKVQVTSNSACNSGQQAMSNIIAMTITAPVAVSVSITGLASICQGVSTALTATPVNGGTTPAYQWLVNGNPVGGNSNTYSSAFSNGDIVTVRLTSNSGCVSNNPATSPNFPITVKPNPTVSVNSPSICNGQTASLAAGGATTYIWTGGLAATANPTTPVLTTTTTYTVTGTTNGCTGSAVATVTVKPKPTLTVNSPSICRGQTASLTAGGATTYTWTGGLAATANPTTPILTATATYTVTGTTNGCTGTAVSTVTVKPNPAVTVNSPSICNGQTAGLTAGGATTYTWTGGLAATANPTTPVLTTTTTYAVTGTTNGCTGTAVSTVTVKPNPSVSVSSPSICNGQTASLAAGGATTYTWTGGLAATANPATPILTSTTTYTVTGTTNGCTGTAIATVTVKPKPSITVNSPSICRGQTASLAAGGATTYTWTGGLATTANPTTPILTSTTTYTVTGTTNGCTGTAVSTVTVKPNPAVTVNNTSSCAGQSVTLTAGGATTYTWTGGLAATANPTTPVLTTSTTYTVTGTTNGCTGTAVSVVTIKPIPVVSVNSPAICNGQRANLTASGAATYVWTGGLSPTANPATPVLTTTTTYSVTGTTNGCTGTATVATVTVKPNPVISVNAPIVCNGQAASLVATGATTYTWTGGLAAVSNPVTPVLTVPSTFTVTGTTNGCTGTATTTVKIKPTKVTNISRSICSGETVSIGTQTFNSSGNYSVILTSSENCDSTVNLNLLVFTSLTPAVSITESKNNICLGEQVVFTAVATNTGSTVDYQWYVNGNPVGTNSAQFSSNALLNGDIVTARITTSASCITANTAISNAIDMTVNSVSFTIPVIEYCKGKNALVDLNIPQSNYTVFWKNGTDTVTTNDDILTVENSVNSNLLFTVKFGNGCSKSGVVPINVNQLPVIDAVVNKPDAKYEEEVQLNANGTGILQYNWLPANVVSADSIKNPTAVITASTLFTVYVKDGKQCESSDSVLVRLINECQEEFIYMPTAFSPNRDGVNDCFGIISPPKLSDFKLTVFNRWGEKVFETMDEKVCWDGMYKGVEAQSDSYVYLLSFKCYNGTDLSKKGAVTIIK